MDFHVPSGCKSSARPQRVGAYGNESFTAGKDGKSAGMPGGDVSWDGMVVVVVQ